MTAKVRLADAFRTAREQGRAALIAYLPAGYPTRAESIDLVRQMVRSGADIIEVGMPYSDPVMDGPVIQRAADIALAGGTTLTDAIDVAAAAAAEGAAACVMSYWNPIERYGTARFARDLAQAGGTAVITPDLNPDEAADWVQATDAAEIERVFLVAPSSSDARLQVVTAHTTGFVYAASMMGVTGGIADIGESARTLVSRTRQFTGTPIAVGLGVSTQAQAADIAEFADGVIVGSAYIRAIEAASDPQSRADAVAQLTGELVAGTKRKA